MTSLKTREQAYAQANKAIDFYLSVEKAVPLHKLCSRFNISDHTLYRIMKERGVTTKKYYRVRGHDPLVEKAVVYFLYTIKGNETIASVAERFNIGKAKLEVALENALRQ